jgi:hypothetical protein
LSTAFDWAVPPFVAFDVAKDEVLGPVEAAVAMDVLPLPSALAIAEALPPSAPVAVAPARPSLVAPAVALATAASLAVA